MAKPITPPGLLIKEYILGNIFYQIFETDNPDVVIERKTVDREVNLQDLESNISELQRFLDGIVDIEILDSYPEEVKELITERNRNQREDMEIELRLLNEELNKYVNNL